MSEAAVLRYHAAALRLLGITPRVDPEAVNRIAKAEAVSGRRLPAAVREWYTLAGAEEFLTLDDNACGVVPLVDVLADLGRGAARVEFYGPRRVNTGYQAFVTLDGSEDPPVVVDGDSEPVPFAEYVRGLAEYKVGGGG
jgi:hypothetical protein